ncbi:SDR family NAD(P)-dependent oxidoreductase [Acinetobacter sp. YK3]|uniref:SDR family NAD(P)-dependent oxidoreductase n=1 Tax=Acinetobacter sp. YK3 TaxID=1860097 RepID=UPI00084C3004|nr:SDR family NAD(P)-dependent oxidoreductase [Acinetobacter sp. YK3]OEC91461.1 hypothetical protein A9Z07_17075 [Acinetobacter sp. YK3]
MPNLHDQVIAITGAGSGIGRALAIQLAKKGAKLAISDIEANNLAETESICRHVGSQNVWAEQLDVSNRQNVHDWAHAIFTRYGKVNVIINNAGTSLSSTVIDLNYEDFEWLMNINFWGVVYGCKAFLPYLEEGKSHIINISSLFGLISTPTTSAYNASKFAVRGFTESLSQELMIMNKGIHVTCVHPGGIKTNIINNGRIIANPSWGIKNIKDSNLNFQKLARTSPEQAAEKILSVIGTPNKSRLLIGSDAKLLDLLQRIIPSTYQIIVAKASAKHRNVLL